MEPLTILLSAAGSPTIPGQLRCFRNNGERDIRIVGIDMSDDPTIGLMVDAYYRVPAATEPDYVDVVLSICRKENVDIYFPNISSEVTAVSKRIEEFVRCGVKVSTVDQETVELLNNKLRVYDFFKSFNLLTPNYIPVYTVEDFINGCKELGYPDKPVCIKLVSNSGSRGVRIIDATKD